MADLTPNDVVNKDFRVGLRGYRPDEVDDFLQQVSDSLYRALEENQRLKGQLDDMRSRLQHFQETEELMKSALMLAERTADEVRQRAHEDADRIRREATDALHKEAQQLEELRQFRNRIVIELRAVLGSHLSLLDSQESRLRTIPGGEEA